MIVVIADDITGAAEIAGIALRNGLDVQFMTEVSEELPQTEVLVIATNTRSGNENEAEETITNIAALLNRKEVILFKKTDSALRGHIMKELRTLMTVMEYGSCLLIPQNPSKNRIIRNGRYYIDDTPLEETSFSYDPEFPATTSYVEQCLYGAKSLSVSAKPGTGIFIADATNEEEINKQLNKLDKGMLLAGASDCFNVFLNLYSKRTVGQKHFEPHRQLKVRHTIIVCGSTQSKSLKDEPYIKSIEAEEAVMPDNVFHGAPAKDWIDQLVNIYDSKGSVIMAIGHKATGGKDYAIRLREVMATAVCSMADVHKPDLLVIEGGATAFALLDKLGWHQFTIEKEYDTGVVGMSYRHTHIILKPGSYSWGKIFKDKE